VVGGFAKLVYILRGELLASKLAKKKSHHTSKSRYFSFLLFQDNRHSVMQRE